MINQSPIKLSFVVSLISAVLSTIIYIGLIIVTSLSVVPFDTAPTSTRIIAAWIFRAFIILILIFMWHAFSKERFNKVILSGLPVIIVFTFFMFFLI